MTLRTNDNLCGPLAMLKLWRDKKYKEIDEEYNKKIQDFNRKISKQDQEVSQVIAKIEELINEGEASFIQVNGLKKQIKLLENQVNQFMKNTRTESLPEINSDDFDLVNNYVQLGSLKCLVKKKVLCKGKSLYALESEAPLAGYTGLCPECQIAHISLECSRGFYVSCEALHNHVRNSREKLT